MTVRKLTTNNRIRNVSSSNYKYLSRCTYYGKLEDWEYVSEAMILKFNIYTATEYYGGSSPIRVYVPTELEDRLTPELIKGENYFLITAPYRINLKQQYRHRVDLLLNIFKEII